MIGAMGSSTDRRMLVLAGIVLSALTLRPQIIAIGPLVDAIQTDLGVSHTVTGLLGTIPLLCMGIFAPAAGPLAARVGATRAMTLVLVAIAAGGLALVRGLGMIVDADRHRHAIGNVLRRAGERLHCATTQMLATGLYACGIQVGAGAAGALAVPLSDALGSWRDSLMAISLACAAVAVAWLPVARGAHARHVAQGASAALAIAGGVAPGNHVRVRLDDVLRHQRLASPTRTSSTAGASREQAR